MGEVSFYKTSIEVIVIALKINYNLDYFKFNY